MALSKVQGAQIESPVDIAAVNLTGVSTATDLNATRVNVTGVATFANATITGDLTVQGTTTTLDTTVENVDLLEVGANSAGAAVTITQAGAGDFVNVGTAGSAFTIRNNGFVGIGTITPGYLLHLENEGPIIAAKATNQSSGLRFNILNQTSGQLFRVQKSGTTVFTIDADGKAGIGTVNPDSILHIEGTQPRLTLSDTGTNAHHRVNADSSVGNLAFDVDYDSATSEPSYVVNIKGEEKLRVGYAGSIGIGTANPNFKVDLLNGVDHNTIVMIKGAGASHYLAAGINSNKALLTAGGYDSTSTGLSLRTSYQGSEHERVLVSAGGSIGIGTDPTSAFIQILEQAATGGIQGGSQTPTVKIGAYQPSIVIQDISTAASNYKDFQIVVNGNVLTIHSGDATAEYRLADELIRLTDGGKVGITTTDPGARLHVHSKDSTLPFRVERFDAPAKIDANFGFGDAGFKFTVNNAASYMLGIDDSASDAFILSYGSSDDAAFGTNNYLVVTTTGHIRTGSSVDGLPPAQTIGSPSGGIKLGGDLNLDNHVLIFSDGSNNSDNIDHIWHSDGSAGSPYNTGGVYHFVSDGTFQTTGAGNNGDAKIECDAIQVRGYLAKGSGSFRIRHPLAGMTTTHTLSHSFIEGPRADLIYRGEVRLVSGIATIIMDEAVGLTTGTWDALCRDPDVFVTNNEDWTPVKAGITSTGILTIQAQDSTCTAKVNWMVVAERQDAHMFEARWTDENGRPILEYYEPEDPEVGIGTT